MCNMKEISKKKEEVDNSTKKVLEISGATIIQISKDIEDLELKAKENIEKLSSLL